MATIKSYTDIEQSRKLAEILPLETADMYWVFENNSETRAYYGKIPTACFVCEPCWSFAALFGILTGHKICHYDNRHYCQYMGEGDEFPIYSTAEYDNPIDACVEMVEKLKELNLL